MTRFLKVPEKNGFVCKLLDTLASALQGLTVVVVPRQVLGVNVEVMIGIQLPELAVDDVEVFVGEVVGDLVDVVFFFQQGQGLKEVAPPQLHHGDATRPRAIHHVEYPLDHLE